MPALVNETSFTIDKAGVYYGQCSELCGARHGFMPIAVEADACVAAVPTSETYSVPTCKAVANRVGVLTAFEGRRTLEAAKLTDCNAKAVAKAGGAQLARQ